ncbi:hypothetical protein OK016_12570 [Vibrio chagasii]|nr:hypothetical protein [Vibrio chagasii]
MQFIPPFYVATHATSGEAADELMEVAHRVIIALGWVYGFGATETHLTAVFSLMVMLPLSAFIA